MAQPGPSARHDTQAIAVRYLWLSWDGRRLAWRGDIANADGAELELCIDDIVFEHIASGVSSQLCERDFAISPSGNRELDFSLRVAGGDVIGSPWRVLHGCAAPAGVDQWQAEAPAMQPLPAAPLPRWTDRVSRQLSFQFIIRRNGYNAASRRCCAGRAMRRA